MRKAYVGIILLIGTLLLGACNETTTSHSIQYGKIIQNDEVELTHTLRNEQVYEKIHEILKEATNVGMSEDELSHFSSQYIQFKNTRQNMLIANYYLWEDRKNQRYICRPFYESKYLFYEVTAHNYRELKKQIEKVKKSKEKLDKDETVTKKQLEQTPNLLGD
ncbi:hypothetical protein [Kurthia gibsonii]|uniref:hypothetical protein n=1 Tax=Kurthia gibsonii TaxID=33946 RepID=UPI0031B7098D